MKKNFSIVGMSCQHCVKAIEMELKELKLKSYNVQIGLVEVDYEDNGIELEAISNAIKEAGFEISV